MGGDRVTIEDDSEWAFQKKAVAGGKALVKAWGNLGDGDFLAVEEADGGDVMELSPPQAQALYDLLFAYLTARAAARAKAGGEPGTTPLPQGSGGEGARP